MINPVYQNHQVPTTYNKQVSQNQGYSDVAKTTENVSVKKYVLPVNFSTVHSIFTAQRNEFLEMQAEIENFFKDFHSGNGSLGGLQSLLERSFATLQRLNAEAGVTNDNWGHGNANLDDFILSTVMVEFYRANQSAALDNMWQEGERQAKRHGVSGEAGVDWTFFDAKFYFAAADAYNAILDAGRAVAVKNGIPLSSIGYYTVSPIGFPFPGAAPSRDFTLFQIVGTGKEIRTGSLIDMNHPLVLKAEREANELFGDNLSALREWYFRRLYALINDEWFTTMVNAGLPSENAKAILEETEREPDINLRRELIMQRIKQNHDELVAGMIDIGLPKDWRQNIAGSAYGSNFQYQAQ